MDQPIVRRDDPIGVGLGLERRQERAGRGVDGALAFVLLHCGAPWRRCDLFQAKDDLVAACRDRLQRCRIVEPGIVIGQQPDAIAARIERLLDFGQQHAGRVEPQMALLIARRHLQLALVQKLMRHDHDQEPADRQLVECAGEKAAVVRHALDDVPQQDAGLFLVQPVDDGKGGRQIRGVDLDRNTVREQGSDWVCCLLQPNIDDGRAAQCRFDRGMRQQKPGESASVGGEWLRLYGRQFWRPG